MYLVSNTLKDMAPSKTQVVSDLKQIDPTPYDDLIYSYNIECESEVSAIMDRLNNMGFKVANKGSLIEVKIKRMYVFEVLRTKLLEGKKYYYIKGLCTQDIARIDSRLRSAIYQ